MLTLQNVHISQGPKSLIENIQLAVFPKQAIGIVGVNGCGKSTLFTAIRGLIEPTVGEIQYSTHLKIMSLEQETPALDISAIQYVLSGDTRLFHTLTRLKQAEDIQDYEVVAECHSHLYEIDGYSAESRGAKILVGLGFSDTDIDSSVKHFSGGWRMRLNLARCLFAPSDLLLLDEPTNHLDMEGIMWLEGFLKNYPGAILLISHDQDFLNNTVTHIAHIENKKLKIYTGNYSSFELQRAQQIVLHQTQYRKQQSQISHMMKFVERFGAKASKAKQAQSRVKMIEKMEMLHPIYEQSPFQFHFLPPDKMPQSLISLKQADIGYGNQTVIKNANISLMAGERMGLLGVNGSGKTTLIKTLCGQLPVLKGNRDRSSHLQVGYFAQHQVDQLPIEISAMDLLKETHEPKTEKDRVNYLSGFAFSYDQLFSPLKYFSGGEKARIALALIIWQKPNLLLLDEPTNHLDLEMRQALTLALQEYKGALLVVSHDRHLLRSLVDSFCLIEDKKLILFEGTVEDYQKKMKL